MRNCQNCNKSDETKDIFIDNYTIKYESWEAYNCCSKECAEKCAISDGIEKDEIIEIN